MPFTPTQYWIAAGLAAVLILVGYLAYQRSRKGGRQGLAIRPTRGSDPAYFFAGCAGDCIAPMITDPPQSCDYCVRGAGWDPSAATETAALATCGGIASASSGRAERALQNAVEAAFDTRGGMSDADLQVAMHSGAP